MIHDSILTGFKTGTNVGINRTNRRCSLRWCWTDHIPLTEPSLVNSKIPLTEPDLGASQPVNRNHSEGQMTPNPPTGRVSILRQRHGLQSSSFQLPSSYGLPQSSPRGSETLAPTGKAPCSCTCRCRVKPGCSLQQVNTAGVRAVAQLCPS